MRTRTFIVLVLIIFVSTIGIKAGIGQTVPERSGSAGERVQTSKRIHVEKDFLERNLIVEGIPFLPMWDLRDRAEGEVVVRVVVSAEGKVIETEVLSGPPSLARKAIDTVKVNRYHPVVIDGSPAEVESTVRLYFSWDPSVELGQFMGDWNRESGNSLPLLRIVVHREESNALFAHFWGSCVQRECDWGEARFYYSAYTGETLQITKNLSIGGSSWRFVLEPDDRLKVVPIRSDPDGQGTSKTSEGEPQFFRRSFTLSRAGMMASDGHNLNDLQAQLLEEKLEGHPENLAIRTLLLGYYFNQAKKPIDQRVVIEARRRHILWLIEHEPESEITRIDEALIEPKNRPLADPVGFEQARQLWLQKSKSNKCNYCVFVHTFLFLHLHDKATAETVLKKYMAQDPTRSSLYEELGRLYAYGILGLNGLTKNVFPESVDPLEANSPFALHARKNLLQSKDYRVFSTAADVLVDCGIRIREKDALGDFKVNFEGFARQLILVGEKRFPEKHLWTRLGDRLSLYQGRLLLTETYVRKQKENYAQQTAILQKVPPGHPSRTAYLSGLAWLALILGDLDNAESYAREEYALFMKRDVVSDYFRTQMDLILGRVALRRGDIEKAKSYLIQAAKEHSGEILESRFPSMALAKELLDRGERQVVIEYLDLWTNHWSQGKAALSRWKGAIESGAMPQFSYATLIE
ncbi:MAG: energy transducer TonB [Terriglobia bacterium]